MLPFTAIRNAKDGAAEVFLVVAGALNGEAQDGYTLLYSRIAEYLRPDHVDAILLSAALLEQLERYELATEIYNRVPRDHPVVRCRRTGPRRGAAQIRQDRSRDRGSGTACAQPPRQCRLVFITLGDALRGLERYDEASKAYDAAIALYRRPAARPMAGVFRARHHL